jgi:A/G-specific adenine glycosylase
LLELASLFGDYVAMTKAINKDREALLNWYSENKRVLPWRGKKDAYSIWISEVMLQQTTVTAVIPYYERFLKIFPNVATLADASEKDVLKYWAGLGYYSRARTLHKAAKQIAQSGFPNNFSALSELPGFGPYTSRAVASLAFGESVGAVDGNVIRVLSRKFGVKTEWWKPRGREKIQILADQLVQSSDSSSINQALMDLGSSHCSTKNPSCIFCPWMKSCVAFEKGKPDKLPLAKPRRAREIWIWQPTLTVGKILLAPNSYAPFLKGQWLPPGKAVKASRAPKKFLFRHSITHHDIFVIASKESAPTKVLGGKLVSRAKVGDYNPTNLVKKLLDLSDKSVSRS